MARDITLIQDQQIEEVGNDSILSTELTSTSKVANWRLWTFISAVSISLFEQVQDIFKKEIEDTVSKASVGSDPWLRDKVLKFQYDATTPQAAQISANFTPEYLVINPGYRIITRCAVVTTANKIAQIKVAKGDTPTVLTTTELAALDAYVAGVLAFAGIRYEIKNKAADYITITGNIYYNGQYSSVISANVIAAINSYLANLDFNGTLKVLSIEDAIQEVTGVTNVVLTSVRCRPSDVVFADGIEVTGVSDRSYQADAGYLVEENEPGYSFATTLNFIAE